MNLWLGFKKLLKNSVITGVPQILATKSSFRKFLKTYVFFACVTGFFFQTFSFLMVYWTYPTVVDVQYYFPDDFDLPALSVCSSNGIKSKLFCKRFPQLCYPNSSLLEFCRTHSYFCDANNNLPENESFPTVTSRDLPALSRLEYQEMGMQPHDIVNSCTVYESPRLTDCTNNYQIVNVFDTKGLPTNCYSFNSLWGKVKGARTIKTKTLLIFVLKSERTQTNQFYTGTPFALQVALHSPYSLINPFMNGFAIKPCSNYYIFPSMQVNELLPPPYTSKCYNYTDSWIKRSGRGPRNKRLCSEECYLNKSIEVDGCVDPFFVTYPNMANICKEEVKFTVYDECRNRCRPACDREDINADVQEHSFLKTKLRGREKTNECLSTITVAFNRMEVVKYRYSAKYESVSLFSYIGGYLGLWLGISLVAICDVLETIILLLQWLWEKIRRQNMVSGRSHMKPKSKISDIHSQLWML